MLAVPDVLATRSAGGVANTTALEIAVTGAVAVVTVKVLAAAVCTV
jgi:hypothetical protein